MPQRCECLLPEEQGWGGLAEKRANQIDRSIFKSIFARRLVGCARSRAHLGELLEQLGLAGEA